MKVTNTIPNPLKSMNPDSWNYYSYGWEKYFDSDKIKEINECIEKEHVGLEEDESAAHTVTGESFKKISTVKQIPYGKLKHLLTNVIDDIYQVINLDFGYHVYPQYNGNYLNLNTYKSDTKDTYGWHTDSSRQPVNDMKLTVIMNLSDEPYTGGEFEIFPGSDILRVPIVSTPGTVYMFKSHIHHRVLPVTSGTRKTLAMFVYGPRFK